MHEPAVTAADLTRRIAERSARVGIIGQGYVGLPLAMEFARVGFAVTGFDTSLDRVTTLNAGRSHTPDVPAAALRAVRRVRWGALALRRSLLPMIFEKTGLGPREISASANLHSAMPEQLEPPLPGLETTYNTRDI